MLHLGSAAAVDGARLDERLVRPLPGGFCFDGIPGTVERLLCGEATRPALPEAALAGLPAAIERLCLVLLDSFGWTFLDRFAERAPFLRRLVHEGTVLKLTTQFPSTTTAHVVTLHTGLPVGEHGAYEWYVYEPAVDGVITPLEHARPGQDGRDGLLADGVTPEALLPFETVYERLARVGVAPVVLAPESFAGSAVSRHLARGAALRSYATTAEALAMAAETLRAPGRRYVALYVGEVDRLGHLYGPDAPEREAEILRVLEELEAVLMTRAAASGSLLLVTADHGMVRTHPGRTRFLNRLWPDLVRRFRTDRRGEPLLPAGSARDAFLHVRASEVEEVVAVLSELLGPAAAVHRTADLVEGGLFGTASARLRERLGDVCVLAMGEEAVWWDGPPAYHQRFHGHHGSLTAAEAHTFLAALPL